MLCACARFVVARIVFGGHRACVSVCVASVHARRRVRQHFEYAHRERDGFGRCQRNELSVLRGWRFCRFGARPRIKIRGTIRPSDVWLILLWFFFVVFYVPRYIILNSICSLRHVRSVKCPAQKMDGLVVLSWT